MSRPIAILVGAVMVAAALALSLLVPTEEQLQSPYVTRIPAVGDRVELRTFTAQVTDVRLAERVQTDEWTGTTDGVWLVVDLEFSRTLTRGGIRGTLRIGDVRYRTSERPDYASIDAATALPGLPVAGTLVIELPVDAVRAPGADDAVLRLGTDADAFLDDVAELHIDLTELETVRSVTILEPGRVAS